MDYTDGSFVWDTLKEETNIAKHGLDFATAVIAFQDRRRKIFCDQAHSLDETRYICIGMVGSKVVTVRFTYRGDIIRIIGAGYWRKGRKYYEKA